MGANRRDTRVLPVRVSMGFNTGPGRSDERGLPALTAGKRESQLIEVSAEPARNLSRVRLWVAVTAVAIGATLWHVIIDYHIGLYGETSDRMSPAQGVYAATLGLTYAWWAAMLALAASGDRSALRSLVWITVIWSVVVNGLVALVAAPPPSSAFPYQDLAHVISLGAGGWSAYLSIKMLRADPRPVGRTLPLVTLGLVLVNLATGAAVFFPNA